LRRAVFGVGAQQSEQTELSKGCVHGSNFTKLGGDIGRSSLRCIVVLEFGYRAAFSKAGVSKLSDVENDAKFRTF